MTILFQSALFILTLQDFPPPTTSFYLELTHLQENVPLNLLARNCSLQYQILPSLLPPLLSNGNLRNTSYMLFILLTLTEEKMLNSSVVLVIGINVSVVLHVSLLFYLLLFPAHTPFSRTKLHSIIFYRICFVLNLNFINTFYFLYCV